ncbi:Pre-mRNA 3'-end-processing factor FIP1 [Paragonimus heterotremus]|uniref:Pre-mRNA 3'-end-processing factor FIP1 n=1 Tax=Paragonimus heterotremus TaxID=100268 RepID=A0A8J4T8Q2_9TREM|nr:Pre-mRNA 3'-end-processing factor FIP1 [Paragonimus heterotremus]
MDEPGNEEPHINNVSGVSEISHSEESREENVSVAQDESALTNESEVHDAATNPTDAADASDDPPEQADYAAAAAAAAVADFDAEDDGDENGEDDDVVNVIIKPTSKGGIYKTGTTYQARSSAHPSQLTKVSRQGIELDDPGDIHGVPTIEFNLSTLGEEDKPWKRPGADITDYFNYGFTEETWVQYCEKQKILRQEYANATLKPVMASGGTGLLHRLRTGSANTGIRSYDNFKQANINVINLSSHANRTGLLGQKTVSDTASVLLNGVNNNSGNLLTTFTQPPPGYSVAASQADGSAAFTVPPPGFSALNAGTASHLLTGANSTGAAGLFPNISLPPPMLGALSNWSGISSLLATGDAVIDPTTGQISTLLDHGGRSPESVYSTDDHGSRRRSRHFHADEGSYFERESYRSRRRSRSSSRDRHSRHRRHHESGRSDRDYDRRSSRRSHRSRERPSHDDRYSSGVNDELANDDMFPAPTSAVLRSDRRSDRTERSSRDHSRSDRVGDREKSSHRGHRRDRERSSRASRPTRRRSRSRNSYRRDADASSRSPARSVCMGDDSSKSSDPLVAAAAAAANIAIALGASGKSSAHSP